MWETKNRVGGSNKQAGSNNQQDGNRNNVELQIYIKGGNSDKQGNEIADKVLNGRLMQ